MKEKRLIFPVLLAAALTACTVPQEAATVPTASPAPSSTPAPTETPAPTQPPSAQLTYEMLSPVERERAPYAHDSSFMPVDEEARRNGLTLVEALRTNDEELLRTTLSDSLLESGLPLPDLTGLVITDAFMAAANTRSRLPNWPSWMPVPAVCLRDGASSDFLLMRKERFRNFLCGEKTCARRQRRRWVWNPVPGCAWER